MQLFPGIEGSTCCEGLTSIATTVTGHWGAFRLKVKGARPGNYWIQAESESKKHSILVQYAPKRYPDQLCYKTYWDIDDEGRLSEGEFIEVD